MTLMTMPSSPMTNWAERHRPTVEPYFEDGIPNARPTPDEFPTKWCVRECERCSRSQPIESSGMLLLEIHSFDKRRSEYHKGG